MKKRGEIALKRTRGLFRLLFHGFHDPFRARLTTRRTLQGFYIRLNNRTGNLHRWNISCTLNRADRDDPHFFIALHSPHLLRPTPSSLRSPSSLSRRDPNFFSNRLWYVYVCVRSIFLRSTVFQPIIESSLCRNS